MNSRIRKLKWNSTLALVYQMIVIIAGLVLPRCFLKYYGSEIYGLMSSITQFLSFINLCDMGIGAVVSSALYKPLANNDMNAVSKIFLYARKFFRIIGIILVIYIISLTLFYPKIVLHSFSATFSITLILAMSISQFGQYFLGITYQLLLDADQKSYVQLIINSCTLIINSISAVLIMNAGGSIQLVKLLTSIIYLCRPLMMHIYVKKKYKINYHLSTDGSVLPQKWSGVIQHISYMIYENTDIVVLTLFSNLANVAIYSVYVLVLNSIKSLINAAMTGVLAFYGNIIANDEKDVLKKTYGIFEWLLHWFSILLFTITGILIMPFVLIYTRDVNDANYNVPLFAILITIAYSINSLRNGMFIMIKSAGHYKSTQRASVTEAILNLTISIIFVFKFGLVGVAVGTLTATTFFAIYEIIYLSKNIVFYPKKNSIIQCSVDILSVFIMVLTTSGIKVSYENYFEWFCSALIVGLVCVIESFGIQVFFYRSNILFIKKIILNKILKLPRRS